MIRYFVITNNEGEVRVYNYSREVFETKLNEGYFGEAPKFTDKPPHDLSGSLDEILVIKGEMVIPKSAVKVTSWEVE